VAVSIAIWGMKYITLVIYLYHFLNAVQVDRRSTAITDLYAIVPRKLPNSVK